MTQLGCINLGFTFTAVYYFLLTFWFLAIAVVRRMFVFVYGQCIEYKTVQ